MNRVEDGIQVAIVNYLRATLPHGWLVMAVSNKPRSQIAGAQEKRMGAIKGWPDVAVYGVKTYMDGWTRPTTYFLEVKAPKGRVKPEQQEVHDKLKDIGFPVAVVRSIDDVRAFARAQGWPSKDTALNDNAGVSFQVIQKARG